MQSVSPLAWLAAEGSRKLRDAGRDNVKVVCFDPLLGWGRRAEQRTECWPATSCQANRREALSSSFPAVAHLLWRHDCLAPGIVHKGAGTSPARDSRGEV